MVKRYIQKPVNLTPDLHDALMAVLTARHESFNGWVRRMAEQEVKAHDGGWGPDVPSG